LTARRPEVAVFGGSFDPPHLAHVLAVAAVLALTDVERVLVVPTFVHPFGKALAPFGHRVRMCELAFADVARVEVSSIESALDPPSYSVRTLEALSVLYPDHTLRLVVGSDLAPEFCRWRDHERIAELAPLLVLGRAGHPYEGAVECGLPDVSSTSVRTQLRDGARDVFGLPLAVGRYVREFGLYANEAP
jgi:nicotinate-nucleotide adenylyltransferase